MSSERDAIKLWRDYWLSQEGTARDDAKNDAAISLMVRQFSAILGPTTREDVRDIIRAARPIGKPDANGDVHCMRLWPIADCSYLSGHYGGCSMP